MPNIGLFGQFHSMPDQKQCKQVALVFFSVIRVPKFYLLPEKLGFLTHKWPNLAQHMLFWSFWAKYWHFWPILSHAQTKNNARCFFSIMWVPKLLLSPVKIRILCPKPTKFGPKLAFLFILGQALPAHLVPCWWVGWWLWRAGCISQDTFLLYTTY